MTKTPGPEAVDGLTRYPDAIVPLLRNSTVSAMRSFRGSARGAERLEPGFRERRTGPGAGERMQEGARRVATLGRRGDRRRIDRRQLEDRKSTRLNSSHE